MEHLDRSELTAAEDTLCEIESDVKDLERTFLSTRSEQQERLKSLREWLEAAETYLPEKLGLEDAERLVEETRKSNAHRRTHLKYLNEFLGPEVPECLRNVVRDLLKELDHPTYWPDEEGSVYAEMYLENLLETAREWWPILKHVSPGLAPHSKLLEIINLLCDRLRPEILALLKQDTGGAQALSLLAAFPKCSCSEHHQLFLEKGMLRRTIVDRAPAHLTEIPSQEMMDPGRPLFQRALRRMDELLSELPAYLAEPNGLEKAFQSFRSNDYELAFNQAASTFEAVVQSGQDSLAVAKRAMCAWSRFILHGSAYPDAAIDALAMLVRSFEEFRSRSVISEQDVLRMWLHHGAKAASICELSDFERAFPTYLKKLNTRPPGDESREKFQLFLHLAQPATLANLMWNSMKGFRLHKWQLEGRESLLLLLYDLEETSSLECLFDEHAPQNAAQLRVLVSLVRRAHKNPSPEHHAAIGKSFRTLRKNLQTGGKPFAGFIEKLVDKLQLPIAQLNVKIGKTLEKHELPRCYRLFLSVQPDDADPPISLRLEFVDSGDFEIGDGPAQIELISEEMTFLERPEEVEFIVRPRDVTSSRIIKILAVGRTVSGQRLDGEYSQDVELSQDDFFEPIPPSRLRQIYEGIQGKPVGPNAFVGRTNELSVLEQGLTHGAPGVVIVYGVRRLGKTSLLAELRRRFCWSMNGASKTLFLRSSMESLQLPEDKDEFMTSVYYHICNTVSSEPDNLSFQHRLTKMGVGRQDLQTASKSTALPEGVTLMYRLREYFRRLKELADCQFDTVIIEMDEFDKLLEVYRKGYEDKVQELMSQLRKAAHEEDHIGVILAGSDLMSRVVDDYRSPMYGSGVTIQLEPFSDLAEARQIVAPQAIEDSLIFDDTVIEEVLRITGGHPFYMKLLGCAIAAQSTHKRVSLGLVRKALTMLLRNEVLPGMMADLKRAVKAPLQALRLMDSEMDQKLARLLLIYLAGETSLESPNVRWARVSENSKLASLCHEAKWIEIRKGLVEAKLLLHDSDRNLWRFRYPVIAEALRTDWKREFEELLGQTRAETG